MVHVHLIASKTRTRWIPSSLVFTNVASETNRPAPVMPPIQKISSRAQMLTVSVQTLMLNLCLSLLRCDHMVVLPQLVLHKLH